MQDRRKDAEYIPKKPYVVTMLIRGEQYYYERFPVDAESAAHAIDQVIDGCRIIPTPANGRILNLKR